MRLRACAGGAQESLPAEASCNQRRHWPGAGPAIGKRLPQGHDSPWRRTEESRMGSEELAPETKGVMVELLSTLDLGPEIEGMTGASCGCAG